MVRDDVHVDVLDRLSEWLDDNPWGVNDSFFPPVKAVVDGDGNIVGIEDTEVPPEVQRRYDELVAAGA